MNLLCRPLVPFLLLCCLSFLPPALGDEAATKADKERKGGLTPRVLKVVPLVEANPTKKLQDKGWEEAAVDLHPAETRSMFSWIWLSSPSKPVRVLAKRSRFLALHFGKIAESIPVIAFVTYQGAAWVGPEQDFYLLTDTGVLGGKKRALGILWCESLLNRHPDYKTDIQTLVARFDKEVDGERLIIAQHGETDAGEAFLKRTTDLGKVFVMGIMEIYGPGEPEGGDIVSVQVEGNAVRLRLKGYMGDSFGTVWIDIKSKKVLRAEYNDKQVFPKSWWSW